MLQLIIIYKGLYLDVCSVDIQGCSGITESVSIALHLEMSETAVAIVHCDGRVQIDCLAVPLYGFLVPPCWDQNRGMGYWIRTWEWGMGSGQGCGIRTGIFYGVWDQDNSPTN